MLNKNQVIQLRDSLNNEGYCQVNNIFHPQLIDYFKLSSELLQLEDLFSDKEENNLVKSENKRDKA